MGERIKQNGSFIRVERDAGYLYYTSGNPIRIYKSRMQHKGRTKTNLPNILVKTTKVPREKGYLYYIDKEGYLSRARMARGRRKK